MDYWTFGCPRDRLSKNPTDETILESYHLLISLKSIAVAVATFKLSVD